MRNLMVILILSVILGGCGQKPPSPPVAEPLLLAVASDLQSVMPRIVERFEQSEGIKAVASFGASGTFAQQLKQGAPYDLFFSANRKYVVDLAADGILLTKTVQPYARGTLVLAVSDSLPETITTLRNLEDPAIKKFAIANPDVAPYGLAARQALQSAGLWDALEPKRVQGESVRQALQFVQTGNVEAALVGKAIANVPGVRSYPVDESRYEPLWQACAVNARSKRPDEAMAFLRFVTEGEGKLMLRDAGFQVDFGDKPAPSHPE